MFLYFKLYILLFFLVLLQSLKCMWYTTMMWNNIRHLASGIIIPISLKKPVKSKLGNIFNRSFVMRIGIFQDITDYEIWKTKSVERR